MQTLVMGSDQVVAPTVTVGDAGRGGECSEKNGDRDRKAGLRRADGGGYSASF